MEFDRLGEVWRREVAPRPPAAELGPLMDRLQALERSVKRRDLRESVVALALLPFVGWMAVTGPSLATRLGALVIAVASALIPIRLRVARRPPLDRGESISGALGQELARLRAQERLLRGVLWWYLGPLGLGVALVIVGSVPTPWTAVSLVAVVAWLYWWIWRLNQRAVEQQLEPRIAEVLSWRASLDEGAQPRALLEEDL